MSHLQPEVFKEAVNAWIEHCELSDSKPQQPSWADSSIDETGMVTLRNNEGFLARYSSTMKRILTNL
jgi:pectate lyase